MYNSIEKNYTTVFKGLNCKKKFFGLCSQNGNICAFTLSEFLITLAIIGIVAALTIPNLIVSYQKKVTVEKLRIAYSIFSQAVSRSIQDNGPISTWELSYSNMAPKYIFPYVETIGTVNSYKLVTIGPAPHPSHLYWGGWGVAGKIYAMKNGMTYSLIYDHNSIHLFVDINGTKGPNRMGRDGFAFSLSPKYDKLVLSGFDKSRNELINDIFSGCSVGNTTTSTYYKGGYCGALIMLDHWKIKDDYPW